MIQAQQPDILIAITTRSSPEKDPLAYAPKDTKQSAV